MGQKFIMRLKLFMAASARLSIQITNCFKAYHQVSTAVFQGAECFLDIVKKIGLT